MEFYRIALCLFFVFAANAMETGNTTVELAPHVSAKHIKNDLNEPIIGNPGCCSRFKKKISQNQRNVCCCLTLSCGIVSILAAFIGIANSHEPTSTEYLCVSKQTRMAPDSCWLARVENCGSCKEWGTHFGCSTNENVAQLYQRLNNSVAAHCGPQAKPCVDVLSCDRCSADTDALFSKFDSELGKLCKKNN